MRILFTILLFLIFSNSLSADVLFLKDGKVIYGKIIKTNDLFVLFLPESEDKNKKYNKKDVLRILFSDKKLSKQYIYMNDDTIHYAFIVDEDAEEITIRENLQLNKEVKIKRKDILSISQKKIEKKKLYYTFRYTEKADTVAIEGEFTAWQRVEMTKVNGIFQVTLPVAILKKNEFQYRYIVNNKIGKMKYIRFTVKNEKLMEKVDYYNFTLGFKVGAGDLMGNNSGKFEIIQPYLELSARSDLPFIMSRLSCQGEFGFVQSQLKPGENPKLEGVDMRIYNYYLGLAFLYNIETDLFGYHPKLGTGYLLQDISAVENEKKKNLSIRNPYILCGLEVSYELSRFQTLVLKLQSNMIIEKGMLTYFNHIALGVNFHL